MVCGDAIGIETYFYDTREHAWVQDSRFRQTTWNMYGQCTAFLGNTLVVVAGDRRAPKPGGSRGRAVEDLAESPPAPTAVVILVMASLGPPLSCGWLYRKNSF